MRWTARGKNRNYKLGILGFARACRSASEYPRPAPGALALVALITLAASSAQAQCTPNPAQGATIETPASRNAYW